MILVDAHVHIYDCFDLQTFFDSALENFQKETVRNGHAADFTALLMLTDWSGKNWFQHLAGYVGNESGIQSKSIGNWTFRHTNESCSLYARRHQGQGLFIIAGRKIITEENLEVLALATDSDFEDGASLEETIQTIKENGAIPVIPWAVGKWMGQRGKILGNLLEVTREPKFFLCDNGNRPIFWPRPYHFKLAETRGIRFLSGSDPLHFASEVRRAGSFGFIVQRSINDEEPANDLKRILLDRTTKFQLYGQLERPYRFLRNQLAMQVLKRKWIQEYHK